MAFLLVYIKGTSKLSWNYSPLPANFSFFQSSSSPRFPASVKVHLPKPQTSELVLKYYSSSFTVTSIIKSSFKYLKFSKFIFFIQSLLLPHWSKLPFMKNVFKLNLQGMCVCVVTVSIKIRKLSTILKRPLVTLSVQFPNLTP